MISTIQLAERMKAGIIADVLEGVVPDTVGGFPELHDYVDANFYGDPEPLLREFESLGPQTDAGLHEALMNYCDLANPAIEIVDSWIKDGGLKRAVAQAGLQSQCTTSEAPSSRNLNENT